MRVSVIGLGYVGAVTAACLAESGFDVIALDKDDVKVACLREGRSPIVEKDLPELIAKHAASGKLRATSDLTDAVMNSDISLLCVGTPSRDDGSLNLDYVEQVCAEIGALLKDKANYHVVVLRSTVTPGTARRVAIPALEKASGKKAGVDFGFANNPEFLREGAAVYDYFHPPKIVIGADDDRAASAVASLYAHIDAPEVITTVDVAEGVKYADNAWHALKIGFANEMGNILKSHGVDSHKVMDIFCLDTKLNISKAYLKPGFAFGGSCLPKDVRALRASAKSKGLTTPLFDSLLVANEEQIKRAHEMIRSAQGAVGLMGLSFKAGTDDLRESPLAALAELIIKDGRELVIYDPAVYQAAHMDGANRKYLRESAPHLAERLAPNAEDFVKRANIFVIGHHGEDFRAIIDRAPDDAPIIDLARLKDGQAIETRKSYAGICW